MRLVSVMFWRQHTPALASHKEVSYLRKRVEELQQQVVEAKLEAVPTVDYQD